MWLVVGVSCSSWHTQLTAMMLHPFPCGLVDCSPRAARVLVCVLTACWLVCGTSRCLGDKATVGTGSFSGSFSGSSSRCSHWSAAARAPRAIDTTHCGFPILAPYYTFSCFSDQPCTCADRFDDRFLLFLCCPCRPHSSCRFCVAFCGTQTSTSLHPACCAAIRAQHCICLEQDCAGVVQACSRWPRKLSSSCSLVFSSSSSLPGSVPCVSQC